VARIPGLALGAVLAGCGGEEPTRGTDPPPERPPLATPAAPGAPVYRVAPPPGKLPWPQHAPAFGAAEHAAMMRDLHLVNNFGLYQAREEGQRTGTYLHSGLDVVLRNGTPIHAVRAGWVRAVDQRVPSYKSLIVEDADAPGHGWGYVHVDDFRVRVGDYVPQGALLAHVQFRGVEHLHLNRLHLQPGGRWDDGGVTHTVSQPDTFFVYTDTEAPRFEGPFHYYPDEGAEAFARAPGGAATVSGDVDVVVGLRDPGEHARGRTPATSGLTDRLAVTRLEYAIVPLGASDDATARARVLAFDLATLEIPRTRPGDEYTLAEVLFKYYRAVQPAGAPAWWETRTSYYVPTNAPPGGRPLLRADDRALSWRTAARDPAGAPRWPNGAYVVTVWARDFRGNQAARADTVHVRN
jgi:hypothetical protein